MKTIQTLGEEFVRRHNWLLTMTWVNNVAICGGCAAAISKGREDYVPKDLDLVATKAGALDLIRKITDFLLDKQVHFRVYANSKNDFVPSPAVAHFRIQCPFWVPICLFVLPEDKFRFYRSSDGYLLQRPEDVKEAADALSNKDSKPRIASCPIEDYEIEDFTINRKDHMVDGWAFEDIDFNDSETQSEPLGQYPRHPA